MTIKELIEKLQEFDPHLPVKIPEAYEFFDVFNVSYREAGHRYSEKELRWVPCGPFVAIE